MDKEFINYLFKTGIALPESLQILLQSIENTRSSTSPSSPSLSPSPPSPPLKEEYDYTKTIEDYIKQLAINPEVLNIISTTISKAFLNEITANKAQKMLNVINKVYQRREREIKKQKLDQLKKSVPISPTVAKTNWNNTNTCTAQSICLETSRVKKEKEEYKECTFHPVTNYSERKLSNHNGTNTSINVSGVYDRLYSDYLKISLKKEMKQKEINHSIGEQTTFSPKWYNAPVWYSLTSSKSFKERLNIYSDRKRDNSHKIMKSLTDDCMKHCTFSPKWNKSNEKIKSKVYDKIQKTCPEYDNWRNEITRNRRLDTQRIENLYRTYQQKKSKIRNIRTEVDVETGVTFKPYINPKLPSYLSKKFWSQGRNSQNKLKDLHERNECFLAQREEFLRVEREKMYNNHNKKRFYTEEEKQQITNNILERLYKEGLQKQLMRNNLTEQGVRYKNLTEDNEKTDYN